jgi:2,3-dihydroxyethylbenzene 1,2-dioxygenase
MQFSKPFHPGRPMHGRFKTGSGGLGHCIIRERDVNAAQRFYANLGMRGGVEYKFGRGKSAAGLVFMHCNDRDHTVAFGIPGANTRLNHIMLEVDNLDDVGMTYDLVRKNKVPVTITPGKHSNDHMYSFYFRSPSGWAFEYGWGARAATYQSEYFEGDVYGHQFEAGGFAPPTDKK